MRDKKGTHQFWGVLFYLALMVTIVSASYAGVRFCSNLVTGRVDAEISGLPELLENSTGQELEAAKAVKPQSHAFWLLGISLGSTAAAALVTFLVVRFITWRKKRRRTRTEQGQTRRGK